MDIYKYISIHKSFFTHHMPQLPHMSNATIYQNQKNCHKLLHIMESYNSRLGY